MAQLHTATPSVPATLTDDVAAQNRDDARRELVAECRRLLGDAEVLFERARSLSGEAYLLARDELDRTLVSLRRRYETLADDAALRAERMRVSADRYVRENPWQAASIAAAIGALVGIALSRRD